MLCRNCRYDLRYSDDAGRCPECGTPFDPADRSTFITRAQLVDRRLVLTCLAIGYVLGYAFLFVVVNGGEVDLDTVLRCAFEALILGGLLGLMLVPLGLLMLDILSAVRCRQ